MLGVLKHPTYGTLFAAQVIALLGTGLMTVALALLAYDLAGGEAGAVLGMALAIKMIAYVGLAPVANAVAERLPRKAVLIGSDLARAAVAVALPFIDAVWQIYVLIFLLQAASAAFAPAFQALIPDVLEDEEDYTKALTLNRLAFELENLISPSLAGLLLLVASYHWLFVGTVAGFLISTLLIWLARLPPRRKAPDAPLMERLTRGLRLYIATPRLRGLLALNMAAASASAFVIVNTVVMVRDVYAGSESAVAIAFAAFGCGSMLAAIALPQILKIRTDRSVMLPAAAMLAAVTMAHGLWLQLGGSVGWAGFLALWAVTGAFYSALLTPVGRLLRRSADSGARPPLFAAQFALSHACWLVTYPLAGWVGGSAGLPAAMLTLGAISVLGILAATRLWPASEL